MEALELGRDAAHTLHAIYNKLCDIEESLADDADYPVARRRVPFNFVTDGAGNGSVELVIPTGWTWNLLRYAVQISTAVTGYVAIYRNIEDGQMLLGVSGAGPILSDLFAAEGDIIGGGERVLIVARALGSAVTVSGNLAIRATQDTVSAKVA